MRNRFQLQLADGPRFPGTLRHRQSGRHRQGGAGMKYHRVVVTQYGGPDVLQVMEGDLPEPRPARLG